MIKRFHLAAEPFGGTVPAGGSHDFTLTVPAEDASLGDLLVNELMAQFNPNYARNITVQLLNLQTSRFFQNAGIYNTLIFGNAHLNCCLPCCFLVQAENTATIRVTNHESVPVDVWIVARGKRFLPKDDTLRADMLSYWNQIPSYPYWLTLDSEEIIVPAGQYVEAAMTVPGTGDFQVMWPRCEVFPVAAGTVTADDILLTVTEGIGRNWQSDPLPMGAFVATPTLSVAGFPGNLYRAASACHCPPFSQLFKRNSRIRHRFDNTSSADAIVRLTYAGCYHQVDECPPGRSLNRIRSLEPTIGPLLMPEGDYCPPIPEDYYPEEIYEDFPPPQPDFPQPLEPAPAPAPAQIKPPPIMYAPTASGAMTVVPGGPLSYMQKYYQPGGGGMATAQDPYAAAHGYAPGYIRQPGAGFYGLGGAQAPQGQARAYYDPVAKQWRRVRR